jgi:antitoxin VapB
MSARAKLFMHGGSQAVRLPKAFRFEGTEVVVRRQGRGVVLEPAPPGPPQTAAEVEAMFARMDALGESSLEYPPEPEPQVRDWDR